MQIRLGDPGDDTVKETGYNPEASFKKKGGSGMEPGSIPRFV